MSIKTFTLRLNDEQHEFLENKSREMGVSKNDYIRSLLDGECTSDKQETILKEILEIKTMLAGQKKIEIAPLPKLAISKIRNTYLCPNL